MLIRFDARTFRGCRTGRYATIYHQFVRPLTCAPQLQMHNNLHVILSRLLRYSLSFALTPVSDSDALRGYFIRTHFSHFWLNNLNANLITIACRSVYRYSGACCCFCYLHFHLNNGFYSERQWITLLFITGSRVSVQSAILLSVVTAVNLLQLVFHIAAAVGIRYVAFWTFRIWLLRKPVS